MKKIFGSIVSLEREHETNILAMSDNGRLSR